MTLRHFAPVLVVVAGLMYGGRAPAQVVASEAWARPAAAGTAATGYLVFTNEGEEEAKLLRIISPLTDRVMIHRSTTDPEGKPRLWPVGYFRIAPGESVRFEASGLRLTFEDVKQPFVAGQKVPVQVIFEGQPEITILLEVKAQAAQKK
jgi:copper(I)-binding protein